MIINRTLSTQLKKTAQTYPAIAILGPRQSGKTTLAQLAFPQHNYVSLEDFDTQQFAQNDPREFLAINKNKHGLILDEIQRVPDLLSYLQGMIDREEVPGYYILTGSHNILLNEKISQTLAGRIAIMTLLPLSITELKKADILPDDVWPLMVRGSYPRVQAREYDTTKWYENYIRTYVERDVREIKQVGDLSQFQLFIRLCAGRIGQLLNLSSLANDADISVHTAKSWLSILEQSYILFLVRPHYKNFSKRLVKAPKLYFYDTGLACSLLGITSAKELVTHYLKGGLFESFVMSELTKRYYNLDRLPNLHFWRDRTGNEVDCILSRVDTLIPIEVKAGKTISANYFSGLSYWHMVSKQDEPKGYVVYTGEQNQKRSAGTVVAWQAIPSIVDKSLV